MNYGWAIVAGGILLHLNLGDLYTFGNIASYLASYVRAHSDPTYRIVDTPWIFSLKVTFQAIFMILGGKVELVVGPRLIVLMGGGMMSAGVYLTSYAMDWGPGWVILTYAVLAGAGTGFCYTAPLVCAMRWMPQNKGYISGLVVAGFGLSATIFQIVQKRLVNPYGAKPTLTPYPELPKEMYFAAEDVALLPGMFRTLALTFFLMQLGAAAVMRNPPTFQAKSSVVPWGQIVRTPQLWNLFGHFALNQFAMTFIATSFKTYGETLPFADDSFLTFVGSIGASFNFFSRIFFGRLADYNHKMAACGCSLLGAFLLVTWTFVDDGGKLMFTIWVCGLYFSGGGNYGLFPVSNAKIFDTSQAGAAYGIVFCGTIVGNLVGALVMKSMVADFGWAVVTVVFGLLVGCGTFVGLLFEPPAKADTLLGTELAGARAVRR